MSPFSARLGRRSALKLTGGLVGAGLAGRVAVGHGVAQTAEWSGEYAHGRQISEARDIVRTDEGGYVIAGRVAPIPQMNRKAWLFRLDASGDVEWSRTYDSGDTREDWDDAESLVALPDGYAFVGSSGAGGAPGFRAVVTDPEGRVRRSRYVELEGVVGAEVVDHVAVDGGLAVLATAVTGYETQTVDETRPRRVSVSELRLVRLDADLEPRWERGYGVEGSLEAAALVRPADGGYTVAATETPPVNCGGDADYWLMHADDEGDRRWVCRYDDDGSDDEVAGLAERSREGETDGYALVGTSDGEGWAVSTDPDGTSRATRTLSRSEYRRHRVADVAATDDGYAVLSSTDDHYWLTLTDPELSPQWRASYDVDRPHFALHIAKALTAHDGEYGLAGHVFDGGDADTSEAFVVNAVEGEAK